MNRAQNSHRRIYKIEALIDMKDGIEKYKSFVISYNYEREQGGNNGMKPSENIMKYLKQQIIIH